MIGKNYSAIKTISQVILLIIIWVFKLITTVFEAELFIGKLSFLQHWLIS